MISMNSSLDEMKDLVKSCLTKLYDENPDLFERNNRKGTSERSMVFRFAYYLQREIGNNFFVDCDFNSSDRGNGKTDGKLIGNQDGSKTKRFIDIIIHKRNLEKENNLVCFEIKKWNNKNREAIKKDLRNLQTLTSSTYDYLYGFHIIIGKTKANSKYTIYKNRLPIPVEKEKFIFSKLLSKRKR